MTIDYTPPKEGGLPFNFTSVGYTPVSDELLFHFKPKGDLGTLRAAINVMQVDTNLTYTYIKACPKYVVGYSGGSVQILYGRCLYGGIRGLQGIVSSYDVRSISASISTHLPANLSALIAVASLAEQDFSASVHGYEERFFTARMLGGHFPIDLYAGIFVKQTTDRILNSFVHVWHSRYITASVRAIVPADLSAEISLILPGELIAYLNVIDVSNLSSSIYSWKVKNLSAYLNTMLARNLSAGVHGRDDMFKNLHGNLKGYASEYKDLLFTVGGVTFIDLSVLIKATYSKDMMAFLYPIQPEHLRAIIKVFHVNNLQGILIGEDYLYQLSASINPTSIFSDLKTIISCIKAYKNIYGIIHSWDTSNLSAVINPISPYVLNAYLNVVGHSKSLHASIYPKMIRLTTVVKISTMEHSDLSGIINTSCFYSDYRNLSASVYTKYKCELNAYIRSVQEFEYKSLSAKIGYTQQHITLDKLKLCINIYPSVFYTMDKLKLNLTFLNAQTVLSAYIRGTLNYKSLGASVSAVEIPIYTYPELLKNREIVVDLAYDGVLESFQVVELSFKSVVSDYYYSSVGAVAWKTSRFEKWMLDVSAYLPTNIILNLKRRLHRVTTLYDLKKFNTVDEAVRFAIDYVTLYPKNDLLAIINGVGRFAHLSGTIAPRYQISDESGLGGMITSIGKSVLIATDSGIIKI